MSITWRLTAPEPNWAIRLRWAPPQLSWGKGRTKENPLLVGSVKANIGHLEAAGGISGLIKVVLSMQQGLIPRQLHFDEPSPHIAWDRIPVKMVVEPTRWPNGETRTASVTALGMSGTNAHVVLESVATKSIFGLATSFVRRSAAAARSRAAHTPLVGAERQRRIPDSGMSRSVTAIGSKSLRQTSRTPVTLRRLDVSIGSIVLLSWWIRPQQATKLLCAFERGESASSVIRGQVGKSPKLAWMFSGEGSEYFGHGRESVSDTTCLSKLSWIATSEQLWQDREGSLLDALFRDQTLLCESCGSNRRCLFCRRRWRNFGRVGVWSPMSCSATAWDSTRRPAWRG